MLCDIPEEEALFKKAFSSWYLDLTKRGRVGYVRKGDRWRAGETFVQIGNKGKKKFNPRGIFPIICGLF